MTVARGASRTRGWRDGDTVNLRSRHDRPLARYFPELVLGLSRIGHPRFVIDGEIVIPVDGGHDFTALMTRLHPATSRVEQLSAAAPATFVAFDALAIGGRDVRETPFHERRALLSSRASGCSSTGRLPSSLLLGLHDEAGRLEPIGRLKGPAGRWTPGEMELDWIPIAPTQVAEVSYDHIDARRLRHPARFRRWRADREPRSCTFEQV